MQMITILDPHDDNSDEGPFLELTNGIVINKRKVPMDNKICKLQCEERSAESLQGKAHAFSSMDK